jgi:hypothetical protein
MSKERKLSSHTGLLNTVWVKTNEYASCKDANRPTKRRERNERHSVEEWVTEVN